MKITKTVPYFYGTIKRFLLYGDHDCDVYATGGDIEVVQVNQTLSFVHINYYSDDCDLVKVLSIGGIGIVISLAKIGTEPIWTVSITFCL